ncbi:hypothetical protein SH669_002446 [Salmonella enterica]|nr:hypothetical protein [Salmonella enterica]ELC8733946.1 hypothetical protein [Salmonella enterica]ELW4419304.1 hypothetical protein [Salmonella enterica]
MTGNLFLKNDGRMHFAIANADGNVRMWLYKDKGGDGVCINNGYDGGGEFVFNKNSEFYSPSHLHAGAAIFGNNGDVYGSAWGNKWLSSWLNNQFAARDNNINARATIAWVNQNFVKDVRLAAPVGYSERRLNERVPGGVMTSWADYGGSNYHIKWRQLQKLVNNQWLTVSYS